MFSLKKQLTLVFSRWYRATKRKIASKQVITVQNSFNVPIIINNFNRYTYLLQLITWLENNGYTNIVILDNNSTYPPLLNYYAITKHNVVYLKKNSGYKALWETEIFKNYKRGYYVYSDPDLVPDENCPADIVFKLYEVLKKYSAIEKCGPALRTDNLPDYYNNKLQVQSWEAKHWLDQVEKDLYNAPVDTTFALYKPFAKGEAEKCKAFRLAGKYSFLHLPWYVNSLNLSEEELYYKNTIAKEQSHWVN